MKNFGAKWLALAAVVGAAAGLSLNGCGGGGGGTAKGGTTGSAGSSAGGKGGSSSTAGTGGSSTGRGGTGGSVSTAGTGGSANGGSGGSSAGGTGGSSAGGTGGMAGVGGGIACPGFGTFDTSDMQGFGLNSFMSTSAGAPVNLAVTEAGAQATLGYDPADGSPSPGSLKVTAPFSDFNQFVDVQHGFGASALKDWHAYKLHVRVKVETTNYPAASPMGVQVYVNTGNYTGYCQSYTNVKSNGNWEEYVLDLSQSSCTTAPVDPTMVIAAGVSFQTGSGMLANDGGINTMKPTAATIHVDSFWLEGSCGGTDGGAGTGGSSAGGTGGSSAGGTGGSSAGGTGGSSAGGTGGSAAGGTGGAATTTLYDFESGVQGWSTTTTGAAVAQSTDQHQDGANSLKITYAAIDNSNVYATVSGPALWPGTVLTFHAFLPAGFDTTGGNYFQAVTQADNYKIFDTTGNGSRTPAAGAWNTWTYTVPNTFPGGLQVLGFQLGDNSGGGTIAAGSVYLDAITASGGTQNCAVATGTGNHTFELTDGGTLDPNVYKKDGTDADTVASQSTDQHNGGTGSWKVAFTGLPAPASGATTSRRVYISGPNIYCGQVATVHVYLPTGSDGMNFQAFAQYNNYAKNSFTGPAATALTRGAWNTYMFTVPSDVGPGGIQQLGVQFNWTGTAAYTGNVYIDDVTW